MQSLKKIFTQKRLHFSHYKVLRPAAESFSNLKGVTIVSLSQQNIAQFCFEQDLPLY